MSSVIEYSIIELVRELQRVCLEKEPPQQQPNQLVHHPPSQPQSSISQHDLISETQCLFALIKRLTKVPEIREQMILSSKQGEMKASLLPSQMESLINITSKLDMTSDSTILMNSYISKYSRFLFEEFLHRNDTVIDTITDRLSYLINVPTFDTSGQNEVFEGLLETLLFHHRYLENKSKLNSSDPREYERILDQKMHINGKYLYRFGTLEQNDKFNCLYDVIYMAHGLKVWFNNNQVNSDLRNLPVLMQTEIESVFQTLEEENIGAQKKIDQIMYILKLDQSSNHHHSSNLSSNAIGLGIQFFSNIKRVKKELIHRSMYVYWVTLISQEFSMLTDRITQILMVLEMRFQQLERYVDDDENRRRKDDDENCYHSKKQHYYQSEPVYERLDMKDKIVRRVCKEISQIWLVLKQNYDLILCYKTLISTLRDQYSSIIDCLNPNDISHFTQDDGKSDRQHSVTNRTQSSSFFHSRSNMIGRNSDDTLNRERMARLNSDTLKENQIEILEEYRASKMDVNESVFLRGFCPVSLTEHNLLIKGNPRHSVEYSGLNNGQTLTVFFAGTGELTLFCDSPQQYTSEMNFFLKFPEMSELLGLSTQVLSSMISPDSYHPFTSLVSYQKDQESNPELQWLHQSISEEENPKQTCSVGVETPLHICETFKDPRYAWNEWDLRRRALQMVNFRLKQYRTHSTQTHLSHFRRETTTQDWVKVREPDGTMPGTGVQTLVNHSTNPPRKTNLIRGMIGKPGDQVTVVSLTFQPTAMRSQNPFLSDPKTR